MEYEIRLYANEVEYKAIPYKTLEEAMANPKGYHSNVFQKVVVCEVQRGPYGSMARFVKVL